jgi:hypothetical protein
MTTFIGIRGTAIQAVSSDPANPEQGQIWYNSSSGTLKGYVAATVGWASAPAYPTALYAMGSAGTQTAALGMGGDAFPSPTRPSNVVSTYNGSAWTATTNYPTGLSWIVGSGTQTAALGVFGNNGGPYVSTANSWNGSAWTAITSAPYSAEAAQGCGTQTAALYFGGGTQTPGVPVANTNKWNGSAWTSTGSMSNARYGGITSVGTQTAALAAGGYGGGPAITATESFNGTSWTSGGALPFGQNNSSSFGTQTAALTAGGDQAPNTATLLYNGTSWTASPASLAVGTGGRAGGAGSQTSGLMWGGQAPTKTANSYIWNGPGSLTTKTITVS